MLVDLLGEELAQAVQEKLGDKQLGVINDGNWIPKSKFNEKNEEVKQLKVELQERDQQLETLTPLATGNEELMKQIQQLQEANEATKNEFESKVKEVTLNSALKLALNDKVQDYDIVSSLIKKDTIELDENGNLVAGLEEQINSLMEAKPFLFKQVDTVEEVVETPSLPQMSVGNPQTKTDQDGDVWAQALASVLR